MQLTEKQVVLSMHDIYLMKLIQSAQDHLIIGLNMFYSYCLSRDKQPIVFGLIRCLFYKLLHIVYMR